MGGSGCRALFDQPENLYLYVIAYRGTGYDRLYGTATEEVKQCLRYMDQGIGAYPILCTRLRAKQEYLHGTYANQVFVPQRMDLPTVGDKCPQPVYLNMGAANETRATENRLMRTRHLVGESSALREILLERKLREHILGDKSVKTCIFEDKRSNQLSRKKYESALYANSAFVNLLKRHASTKDTSALVKAGFLNVNTGVTCFSLSNAKWLFHGGKTEVYSLMDITTGEDIYLREEVSIEESLKVGGIRLTPIIGNKMKPVMTSRTVGLWQINSTMLDWADEKCRQLREARDLVGGPISRPDLLAIFSKDREWVNDDSLLIQVALNDCAQFSRETCVAILVTDDRRLANQMSNTCNIDVIRVRPLSLVGLLPFQKWDSSMKIETSTIINLIRKDIPSLTKIIKLGPYLDTGSIASACSKLTYMPKDVCESPTRGLYTELDSGIDAWGKRYCHYAISQIPYVQFAETEVHRPSFQHRRYRTNRSYSFEADTKIRMDYVHGSHTGTL